MISEIFIRRPVATSLLTIGVMLAGALGYARMPVSPLPRYELPAISVQANMPGASPDAMAASVAAPLERHLGVIADVDEMTSQSTLGMTRVTLQFGLDRDIDGAARDVQGAINAARADLPPNLRQNPVYHKINPADAPIMVLGLTSNDRSPGQLYDLAANVLQQRLSQLSGVGEVDVWGSASPAVRVELNPDALTRYGLGFEDIRAALAAANADSPKGVIEEGRRSAQIYANDQAFAAADYRDLVIAYRNGAPIRLTDVGDVVDSVEDIHRAGLVDGKPGVVVSVMRQPAANVVSTVDGVRAELPRLAAALPADVELTVALDRSKTIRRALSETQATLLISAALVVGVVFAFLRSLRAALIAAVAVPTSIAGALAAMSLLGFNLDNLSLMALIVSTGFVVDDAIVVLENITRHIERGAPRLEAAICGAKEVAFTVVSISLSLIAVFAPLLFFGGVIGRLFREFAMTLSLAVAISLVVSLSVTPMLCAWFAAPGEARGFAAAERVFARLEAGHRVLLAAALRHRRAVLAIFAATIAINGYLFAFQTKYQLFPAQDTGLVVGTLRGDQSLSFTAMRDKLTALQRVVRADPAVESVVGFTGGKQSNAGSIYISLKAYAERGVGVETVMARLREALSRIEGAHLYLAAMSDLLIGARPSAATYQYALMSDDAQALYAWAPKLLHALAHSDILTDVNSDEQRGGLETVVAIDRDSAARLGLSMTAIDNTLYDAFGQRQVSVIRRAQNQYHVVMEADPRYASGPQALDDLFVSTAGGAPGGVQLTAYPAGLFGAAAKTPLSASAISSDLARNFATNALAASGRGGASAGAAVSTAAEKMIPLRAFAQLSRGRTPLAVNHQGQFAAVTLSFNLAPGRTLDEAAAEIRAATARIAMPAKVHGAFAGTAATYQEAQANMVWLFVASLAAIYIVLGVLYESLMHPITILSSLFSASLGAALALQAFGLPFTVIAAIGLLLLIGIVKKNAILMIDFALDARRRGLGAEEAIVEASQLRFRSITMTSLATFFGAMPLMFGAGEGTALRLPLGVAIAGGLILSQCLTLYITPVIFVYLEAARRRV
ncbi:MAG: efflux RND transporter permease subunit [Pseudomonadota bacterium]|nr:efflux RND transporter permease subunit [Pseudomonadota bacterium]